MNDMGRKRSNENEEIKILRDIDRTEHKILERLTPKLRFIKIAHGGNMQGPFTVAIGGKVVCRVLGFDQNGAPFPIDFNANPVTWAIDNAAVATSTPETDPSIDDVVGVSAGVANLTATCGGFSDTETATVPAATPVLSSIKIDSNPA